MAKTGMIRARTEPGLKSNVERILKKLGITSTEAINLFYRQIQLRKGLPFDVRIPNKTTMETFKKTDAGAELNTYETLEEFIQKMRG
ncbi:MAG: type II toxin-antitoxin system RelB/DinJ family antitoxin [Nitrospirota bacterium]